MSTKNNADPLPAMVYKEFGKGGDNIGSTIIKTCPSGDYDKDNYCGDATKKGGGLVNMYTKEEQGALLKNSCCLKLSWKSDPPYMSDAQVQ